MPVEVNVKSDATAAIGMVKQLGLGKVRHLATADLWVQQRRRVKHFTLEKWPGGENPSDLMTKPKGYQDILRLLGLMNIFIKVGRARSAPIRNATTTTS